MIIVTGGAGFIGSNIVKGLNARGHKDIVIVDNLKHGSKHLNLNSLEFLDYLDITEFESHLDSFGKVEIMFHQGACSSTTEQDGEYMMKTNYTFSKNMFSFCEKHNARFLYASSASVYGNGDNGFVENRSNEYPLNVYAYSKFLFDQWIRQRINKVKNQVVGLRYFNVFGPQENHKGSMASVIFHFFNQIKNEGKIKVFEGSKDFIRDFIFIDDIVDINMFLMDKPEISGIFNSGTGQARSFMDIAEIMSKAHGNVAIEEIPFPDHLKGKYQKYTQADMTLFKTQGYGKNFTSLEDGVLKYNKILEESNGLYL